MNTMEGKWLVLAGGYPHEPQSFDELADTPAPRDLWPVLFRLANIDVTRNTFVERGEIPREERFARGFCGTPVAGYRWEELTSLDSSIIPMEVTDETYGLPGIEARWSYRFEHEGQAGHAAFRHIELRVRFATPQDYDAFCNAWQRVFGSLPSFSPIG